MALDDVKFHVTGRGLSWWDGSRVDVADSYPHWISGVEKRVKVVCRAFTEKPVDLLG